MKQRSYLVERTPAATSTCPLCASEMPAEARKCAKCGAYADWRRRLPGTEVVLALITSILAIITVALPYCMKMATWNASTSIYVAGTRDYGDPPQPVIVVRAVNSGHLDAIVRDGNISFATNVAIQGATLKIANSENIVLRTDTPSEIYLAIDGLATSLPASQQKDDWKGPILAKVRASRVTVTLNVNELLAFNAKRLSQPKDACSGESILPWVRARL